MAVPLFQKMSCLAEMLELNGRTLATSILDQCGMAMCKHGFLETFASQDVCVCVDPVRKNVKRSQIIPLLKEKVSDWKRKDKK